jgi:hypothetical protein
MIKLKIKYGNSQTDLRFPCTEKEMNAALERIHAEDVTPLELYVSEVVFPEELGCLQDRFVNLDEVNYLGKRMDNIFVMMSEQNNCTMEDLIEFDKLPYKNKVVFTKQPYPNIKSGFYISGFETKKEIGTVLAFKNVFSAKRFYDCFPYVDWFNGDYRVEQDTTNENTIHSV